MLSLPDITANFGAILQKIRQAENIFQRPPGSVKLLAASKDQDVSIIEALWAAGQKSFGENYCQEGLAKIHQLSHEDLEWHYIGGLQANKTRAIAENFAWVQSVDRIKIAERLNSQRPQQLPELNVCIQVNISHEQQKMGVDISEVDELAQVIQQLPRLQLRGLMVIPQPSADFQQQLHIYQKAYNLHRELLEKGFSLDTLSMGMTHDFMAAIAAGSTMVRIGTGIFGPRIREQK